MIAGVHALVYSEDAGATRAFLRDVLGFPSVDAHGGWLIFALPPAELGVHPGPGWGKDVGRHELWFMCHDVDATRAELEGKGVEFTAPVTDDDFGRVTEFRLPGVGPVGLYQPTHLSPLEEFA